MSPRDYTKVDNTNLLKFLRNAERAIESNSKFAKEAPQQIADIHAEWMRRAEFKDFETLAQGDSLLEFIGYHVGKHKGLKKKVREEKLRWVFENPLPVVGSPEDYFEFGEPKSAKRIEKLKKTLKGRNKNYGGEHYMVAREQTEEDLIFLSTLIPSDC